MKVNYLPTGNFEMSLPSIQMETAAIENFTFLHMGYKGLINVTGKSDGDYKPLLTPFVSINNTTVKLENISWTRDEFWIPNFKAQASGLKIDGTILCPIGHRGFVYKLIMKNASNADINVKAGLKGYWGDTLHSINEDKIINAEKHVYESTWNHGMVFDMRVAVSIFSFAPMFDEEYSYSYNRQKDGVISFKIENDTTIKAGEETEMEIFFGLGYEEVASTTSAKEMVRQGFRTLLDETKAWLSSRKKYISDKKLNEIMNINMFFNIFFAAGMTMDTEDLVLVTSRSPRYYVSAAYWDRDSLLWSLPSISIADQEYAKEMLEYFFNKQIKNVGIHSRYIDGTILEPGFELDELCAPVIALNTYAENTGDYEYLKEMQVIKGIERILKILDTKKHPDIDLYETFLQPTDDMHVYKYITYDNVLVWKMLKILCDLYKDVWSAEKITKLNEKADNIEKAIYINCVITHKQQQIFAWSVDTKGKWDIYDEPPGSLQLLYHYGFCKLEDEIYKNTVNLIRGSEYEYNFAGCNIAEIGCPHSPHPWVLSIANSMLSGYETSAREHLLKCSMDSLIACESVDENTGECVDGQAFATCAGFLAYAIYRAFGKE